MNTNFSTLDLGSSKAIPMPLERIEVIVSNTDLVRDYAKAFVNECYRVNPLMADRVGLTPDELNSYFDFLLTMRVQSVSGNCNNWNRLKVLYIPSYYQFVLSMVGEVTDRKFGFQFVPKLEQESQMTLEEAMRISSKIGEFLDDLQIVQDAMPRNSEGDINVMGTVIIQNYVCSYREVEHPAFTYVTAMLGNKIAEDVAFSALYRIQYDDVSFIQSALTSTRVIY